MEYDKSREILRDFYAQNGILKYFERDNTYLETAFHEINEMWFRNLECIKEVKYLMIAEAPLWGKDKSYIYNPETKNTSFFYKSDLEYVLNIQIADKQDFINCCNEIGLLIIDISPFALNTEDTIINYRSISANQYLKLVKNTFPFYFEQKLMSVSNKKSDSIKAFFRYARVKKRFLPLISEALIDYHFIKSANEISDISKQGWSMDKVKIGSLISRACIIA